MNVKTFKAKTLADALRLVRDEFGHDARVISTKDTPGLWSRLTGRSQVEVTAFQNDSDDVSRVNRTTENTHPRQLKRQLDRPVDSIDLSCFSKAEEPKGQDAESLANKPQPSRSRLDGFDPTISSSNTKAHFDYRQRFKEFAEEEAGDSVLESMIEQYAIAHDRPRPNRVPPVLFQLFSDLIEADVDEEFAQEIIDDVQQNSTPTDLADPYLVRDRAFNRIASQISIAPEIRSFQGRRVVALIGPTGVGKTTTIAKLAANLRLRDNQRVGLITVDTYRIAAVEQLRAYADILDVPMEVVTTPREMRDAVARLSNVDIVLIDTAGRSPRDEIQIQELRAMLSEARPDETHLVLSSVSGGRQLTRLVDQFRSVNPSSLLLTKLDESEDYGHLLSVVCKSKLPLSYTTHGQNVPDDIQAADPLSLIESVASAETE